MDSRRCSTYDLLTTLFYNKDLNLRKGYNLLKYRSCDLHALGKHWGQRIRSMKPGRQLNDFDFDGNVKEKQMLSTSHCRIVPFLLGNRNTIRISDTAVHIAVNTTFCITQT